MTNLIVTPNPAPDENGRVLSITPESAGWTYVGFEVYRLKAGESFARETLGQEACLVLLSGRADIATKEERWTNVGGRMNVFEKTPPYSVYVPAGDRYEVTAATELELAVCLAPGAEPADDSAGAVGGQRRPARLIGPDSVGVEHRGSGSMARLVHNILPESEPADSLLVVEVFTPGGHWSSYPPHKHDQDALPDESLLEETYYFRVDPEQGFAVQRVYTDDRTLDETMVVRDREAVLVPKGYHPVSAPPGYDVYYLNVMAGPKRVWKFRNDPDHDWLMNPPSSSRQ